MQLTIHRGSHEIGGSCVEVRHRKTRIILDIGMPLIGADGSKFDSAKARNKSIFELLGEGILPSVKGLYKGDTSDKPVDAVLISHAHLDHYGLIEYIQENIPVYAGKGTRSIFHLNSIFIGQKDIVNSVIPITSGKEFKIGALTITPYLMDHSAFDAYAFVIEGGGKTVIYSGDFRAHGRKAKAFEYFLKKAPKDADALLLEGSMLGRDDGTTLTENKIQKMATDILKNSDKIIFVYSSSQNIDRLVSFYKAAIEANRQFIIDVYTANVLETLKDTPGVNSLPHPSKQYEKLKVYFPSRLCRKLELINRKDLMYKFKDYKIHYKEISENPGKFLMIIRPTVMDYVSRIKGIEGSSVIYSMWQGYKEDDSMKKFFSLLDRKNINVINLHTSGHATINTLRRVSRTLQPKKLIPIHTFHPDQYLSLFENVELVKDGQEIVL